MTARRLFDSEGVWRDREPMPAVEARSGPTSSEPSAPHPVGWRLISVNGKHESCSRRRAAEGRLKKAGSLRLVRLVGWLAGCSGPWLQIAYLNLILRIGCHRVALNYGVSAPQSLLSAATHSP